MKTKFKKLDMNYNGIYRFKIVFFVCLIALLACATPVYATHTSSAELQPEWSPAGQDVDYTVTICNNPTSTHSVDEVRIYMNENYTYNIPPCDEKEGWELNWINVKKACHYIAYNSSYYITPGGCDSFNFTARTPDYGCEWSWKFESRDVTDTWRSIYDTTSVDDLPPEINKEITGPQAGACPPDENDECWITQSTEINISVIDQGECGKSGLDWCEITYTVDGGSIQQEIYQDLNGQMSWNYALTFDEDSVHVLNITCQDIAGNKIEDIETFKVDSTPPETNKIYGEPHYPYNINGGVPYPHWISTSTPITLLSVVVVNARSLL